MFSDLLWRRVLAITVLFVTHNVFASCEREDVDHYLDKGFSPEQITKICAADGQSAITSEKVDSAHLTSKPESEPDGIELLSSAIAATEIKFSDDTLSYVSRECIEFGTMPSGLTVGGKKFCGFIRKTIQFNGLTVSKKPLLNLNFFAKPSILVAGDINHEVLDAEKMKLLTLYDRKLLMQRLNQVTTTKIPVREAFLVPKVRAEIDSLTN